MVIVSYGSVKPDLKPDPESETLIFRTDIFVLNTCTFVLSNGKHKKRHLGRAFIIFTFPYKLWENCESIYFSNALFIFH